MMSKSENFRDHPKILKIENDGQIVGLDKHGRFNNDFNTNNVNDDEFYNVFGADCETLHDKYVNENLAKHEKNRNNFEDSEPKYRRQEEPYNERDFRRDLEQQNEIKRSKRKSKMFGALLVLAVIIIATSFILGYFSDNKAEENQVADEQANNNEQLQREMDDTKNQLQNSQQNEQDTQQKINDLQSKINNMSEDNSNQNSNVDLQNGINQLQEAQNSKVNGNKEEMKENLKKVDDVIDTEKISEKGKNQWEKFKGWLDENISW